MLKHATENLIYAGSMLDESFVEAVGLISTTESQVILVGIGKSGIIAGKLSSTLISIGFLSHYLHPVEALHGDLGIIRKKDIIIILSNSGETEELLRFIQEVKKLDKDNKIISITAKIDSSLAKKSDIVILTHVERETMDINDELVDVPSTSTMVTLILGDVLSFAAAWVRGFNPNIIMHHPGGSIGKLVNT